MPRPSSSTPLLGHRGTEVYTFNVLALTTFWVFQLEWMALHVLVLETDLTAQDGEIAVFSVERILLYILCITTINEIIFEIVVYANHTSRFGISFTPKFYLRCNILKVCFWSVSSIITVINDYLYDAWGHYLRYRGFSTVITMISMTFFILPAIYAKHAAITARKHEQVGRYGGESSISLEE